MNKLFKKTQKDFVRYFISKLVYAFRSLLLLTLYSYLLIPEVYGRYSLIMGIVNILLAIFIGWITSSAKRYYDNYKDDLPSFFSNISFLWFFMNLLMGIIIIFILNYSNIVTVHGQHRYILLTMITISLVKIFENIIRAARLSKFYLYLIIVQSITQLGTFFILAKYFDGALFSVFLSLIISNSIFILLVIRKINISKYKFSIPSRDFQKIFFNYGFPMVGIWGLDWLLNLSDRFIIKLYSSDQMVGIYDINYKIAGNSIGIFASSIIMAIFPLMVKAWNEKSEENVSSLLSHGIFLYLIIALPSVFGLIAVRSLLYGSFLSEEYINGEMIIVFISIALFFSGLTQLLFNIWKVKGEPKFIFYTTSFVVVLNLILNFSFIPIYGYIFAAISTFIAYFISFLIVVVLSKKHLSIVIDIKKALKILMSSMFMFLVVTFFIQMTTFHKGITLLLSVVLGVIVYITLLYFIGIVNEVSEWVSYLKNR